MTKYVTRFAPSPTGSLHLGGARTALINFIISQQNNFSKFFLRIEDTDKERSKTEHTRNIIKGLQWLQIKWEKNIQYQSDRILRHQEIAKKLLSKKFAYKCNCSEKILSEKRNYIMQNKINNKKLCTTCKDDLNIQTLDSNFVVRINIPTEGNTKIEDKIQGRIIINNIEIDDYILLRKDGTPTYMLSAVVDDYDLGVNFIIRGNDHLNNTFRQKYIYEFLNWKLPEYAHIPLIHGEDGSKLSKRHGDVNLIELKEKGYLAEAIINNLILLGWSPNNKNEILSYNEILHKYKLDKISKSSSIFSYKKLNYFNNHYLRKEENLFKFIEYCESNTLLKKYLIKDKNKLLRIFQVYKNKLNYYEEIIEFINIYYDNNFKINNIHKFDKKFETIIEDFVMNLNLIKSWEKKKLDDYIKEFINLNGLAFPVFGKNLRNILINTPHGPSLSDLFIILEKKDSIDRLNRYISVLKYG